MKWLDDMQRKRTEKTLQRNIKKVSNPFASSDGRYASIDTLREMGTPEAIKGLMHRFDFTAQQTMVDAEEKEYAVKAVLYFGERAVDPIKKYLRVCTYPSWPVKLLREITSDEVVLESLLDLLDAEDTAFRRAAEDDVFARMEWRTHGRAKGLRDKLPEGFLMTKDGVIKRVGRS